MERGHKALGLHSALYPRDHALQADANDTLLGDDANRCSQAASSPQPPACFWMHASSWTSLFRLLHFGRAANGLARAGRCEPVPSQLFAPRVMRNCRDFYHRTHGCKLGPERSAVRDCEGTSGDKEERTRGCGEDSSAKVAN
jgi:hypothetical protein